MRSVWVERLRLKPWMDPVACAGCDKRFLREECDCERVKKHLIERGLLFHVKRVAAAVIIMVALGACNETMVVPLADYQGHCRHEAMYCALVIQEYGHDPWIVIGDTSEGRHAECKIAEGWVRMTYHGVTVNDDSYFPMENQVEYTVAEYQAYIFGWSIR